MRRMSAGPLAHIGYDPMSALGLNRRASSCDFSGNNDVSQVFYLYSSVMGGGLETISHTCSSLPRLWGLSEGLRIMSVSLASHEMVKL